MIEDFYFLAWEPIWMFVGEGLCTKAMPIKKIKQLKNFTSFNVVEDPLILPIKY